MSSIVHDSDAGFAEVLAKLDRANATEPLTFGFAVIGLTNFGERPLEITRLAKVLDMPVSEAKARARKYGMAGKEGSGGFGTRLTNGLITVDPERAKAAPRRRLQIGDRRIGVTGCAPDIFLYAPLLRPSVQVEETCPVTGTLLRLVFTTSRVEHVEPARAVLPLPARSRPCTPAPRRPATASRSTPTPATPISARRPPCSPPPRRLRDGSTPTPAAGYSPSGRPGT